MLFRSPVGSWTHLKMLLFKWVQLPTGTSLLIIAGILGVALLVSWLKGPQDATE